MPGMDGINSIKKVVDAAGDANVVLFSANADTHTVARAIEVGVRVLCRKPCRCSPWAVFCGLSSPDRCSYQPKTAYPR